MSLLQASEVFLRFLILVGITAGLLTVTGNYFANGNMNLCSPSSGVKLISDWKAINYTMCFFFFECASRVFDLFRHLPMPGDFSLNEIISRVLLHLLN